MATAVTMPRFGLSMVEGTVVEWKAKPGESVAKGQVILVIESEKAEVEVEAVAAGVLGRIYVDVGTTVPIGSLLGAIVAPAEKFDPEAFQKSFVPEVEGAPATARSGEGTTETVTRTPLARGSREPAGLKVAPAARALAKRLGVDLTAVTGTGPGGRILPEDVERAQDAARGAGGLLAHTVAGSGPSVVLIAGFAVDATGWRRQVDGLSPNHTVVTFDHRGIAASPPSTKTKIGPAELADEAHDLLVDVGKGPYVLVGASMGAAVAIEVALRHRQSVRGLVLMTPVLLRDARLEAVLRSWAEGDSPTAEARIRGMLPWLFGRAFLAEAGKREAAAAALRTIAGRTPLPTLRAELAGLVEWLGSRTEDVSRLDLPTLIIAGGEDLLAPGEHAAAAAYGIPGSRLEALAGAGHAVMIERADEVNHLVRGFVTGIG